MICGLMYGKIVVGFLLHTSNNANVLTANNDTITMKVRCRTRMESLEAENELDHHRKV